MAAAPVLMSLDKFVEMADAKLAVAEQGIEMAVASGNPGLIIAAANAHLLVAKEINGVNAQLMEMAVAA